MFRKIPFYIRITLIYIVLGAMWILFSDRFVLGLTQDPYLIHTISLYKGWFFVLMSGLILFYLVRREMHRRTIVLRELEKAKKRAEESEKLKSAFLSNLSHYLRTPMNSILGFTELISEHDIDEEKQQRFKLYIRERCDHLLKTINSIVEISQLQEGIIKIENENFSLNRMIDAAADLLNVEIEKREKPVQVLVSKFLPDGNDLVKNDKDKVFQILSCLIENAATFTQKGSVELAYYLLRDSVVFKLKDTGIGIDPQFQKMLFKSFLFNSSLTRDVDEGATLSLYISSELAKKIGGRLWLEKSNSKGSTFCLSIPFE